MSGGERCKRRMNRGRRGKDVSTPSLYIIGMSAHASLNANSRGSYGSSQQKT